MPPQRIVIHAGFHKTGTTSVQAVLKRNRRELWPVMAIGLRDKFESTLRAARTYAEKRDTFSLHKAAYLFGKYVDDLNLSPKRQLLVSAEDLSGCIAGRLGTTDFSAAPELLQGYAEELQALFGRRLELTFVMGARAAPSWYPSAYWQHIKASRMTESFDDFVDRCPNAADFATVLGDIRDAVPDHRVLSNDLDDCRDLPFGPATPILNLMRMPPERRAALKPVDLRNARGDDALLRAYLDLNRSDLDDATVEARKKQLWAERAAHGSGLLGGKETG